MNVALRVPLHTSAEQTARLMALQQAFAQVCNHIAPVVQQSRVWNRVALHHMVYRPLREAFPQLGSQMVCNAVYAVSRTCRLVFQSTQSPFHIARLQGQPLPLLRFAESAPVYFDRHTLTLRGTQASMFTLDGRMKFELSLLPAQAAALTQGKLKEIALQRQAEGFALHFTVESNAEAGSDAGTNTENEGETHSESASPVPSYLHIEECA